MQRKLRTLENRNWTSLQCTESEEVFKAECTRLGLRSAYLNI